MSNKLVTDFLVEGDILKIRNFQKAKLLDFRINLSDNPNMVRKYIEEKERTIRCFDLLCLSYVGARHIFSGNGRTLCGHKAVVFVRTRDDEHEIYCENCMNEEV